MIRHYIRTFILYIQMKEQDREEDGEEDEEEGAGSEAAGGNTIITILFLNKSLYCLNWATDRPRIYYLWLGTI